MSETKPKKRLYIYTDAEFALMKSVFLDNPLLITAIRKVFLQIPLTAIEAQVVATTFGGNKPLLDFISKCYLPQLDPDVPLGQLVDLWTLVDLKEQTNNLVLQSNQKLIDIVTQQLAELNCIAEKKELPERKISLKELTVLEGKEMEDFYVGLKARNDFIIHNDKRLHEIIILAQKEPEETIAQMNERIKKDSTR